VGDDQGNGDETLTISGTDDAGNPSLVVPVRVPTTGRSLFVGGDANTQIEVKDGGALIVDGQTEVGRGQRFGKLLVHGESGGHKASCKITGAPGGVRISSQIVPSEFIVTDGGLVQINGEMAIGTVANERGSVSISGSDSSLTCSFLTVGADGGGEMTISDGAHVDTNQNASVGATSRGIIETPPPTDGGKRRRFRHDQQQPSA
jgi:T5SS/PEP-CTERM-associated repeat protein